MLLEELNNERALASWLGEDRALIEMDREIVRRGGLRAFIELAWPTVEGGVPYSSNWHIDAICDHLEAVSRGDLKRLLITVPPRSMKPVWENEMVLLEDRGRVRLADVRVGDRILTHKGRFRHVTAVHDNGLLPTVRLKTWQQRSVRMAPDHPVLTTRGWVPCGQLTEQDVVGIVPPQGAHGSRTMSPEEARLLGYIIGDGSVSHANCVITQSDPATIADIELCVKAMGWHLRQVVDPGKVASRLNIQPMPPGQKWPRHDTKGAPPHPVRHWLQHHGLYHKTSYTKRVPDAVMRGDAEIITQFLGAYWSCDGQFSNKSLVSQTDGYKRLHVEGNATTVGIGLAADLQHILLRMGIEARVRRRDRPNKTKRQTGDRYVYYNVTVSDLSGVADFARKVPMAHARFERIVPLAGLQKTEFDRAIWSDAVMSVEPDEPARCLCLTVDEDHSFTAGDVAVHNSVSCAVMFPAWDWIDHPERRFLFSSYAHNLSIRDSARCRRVISSPWYQARWGDRFTITSDQNTKIKFENDKSGYRLATSVGGQLTGEGGNIVLVDDSLNSKDADSTTKRESMLSWWRESMSTRLNSKDGAFVIIQQRLHEMDLVGDIIRRHGLVEHGGEYTMLCLPARYEHDHPQRWQRDPRTEDGQLLWPAHVPETQVKSLEAAMGPYATSSQMQQRPAPREGGIFKRRWFTIVDDHPGDLTYARGWDLAATTAKMIKSDPDWTATVKIGWSRSVRKWYITDVRRWREEPATVEALILRLAREDAQIGPCRLVIPKDPGQAGVAQAKNLLTMLAGFDVVAEPQSGDKMQRAMPLAGQAGGGNVAILKADWNETMLAEITTFPTGSHDDMVDAAASAFTRLTGGTSGIMEFYARALEQRDAPQQPQANTSNYTTNLGAMLTPQRY